MKEFRFTVTKEDENLGVKKILRKHFDFSSRLFAKLKAQRRVFLNDVPLQGFMKPKEGDVIRALMPEEESHFEPEDIPVIPVYEDEDLLIINKPAHYTVHPTKGHSNHTMANGIMKYMKDTGQSFKIRFANRLDMDTTGLLIIAKNSHAQDELVRQMHANILKKYYLALVIGEIEEDQFTVDLPIGKKDPDQVKREVMPDGEGRPSVTHVKVLRRYPGFTLVKLRLETGRTHQIRVHLSYLGHPIAGDPLYGGSMPDLIDHQALHAYRLEFRHPDDGHPVSVEAEMPPEMKEAIRKVENKK